MPQVIWMNKKYGKEWEKSTKPLLSTKKYIFDRRNINCKNSIHLLGLATLSQLMKFRIFCFSHLPRALNYECITDLEKPILV